jgi:glycosyltransferase involved in cell wall biosynthesis
MRPRARIVHVATTDITLALLLGPQLRAFTDAGYEVIVASAPGPYVEKITSWGIRHEPLAHATRSMAPRQDAQALFELRTLFRRLTPDLVHTHNPKTGIYGRIAARLARVPAVVNTVHGLYAVPEDTWAKRAVVYSLERSASTCSDAELLVSVEDFDVLRRLRVPERKLHLLGNGVDLARFDPERVAPRRVADLRCSFGAGPDDIVCGVVGRLVWEKGYREVFEAAARLRTRVPNVRVVVVGPDEPEKDDAITREDIARAEREGGVRFLGMRDDVEDLYAAMDLYVLASYREGFPRSAMEAAAMRLPLVVTNVRGCRQVVDDGVTGTTIPMGDAVALADAVAAIAEDDAARLAMGQASRAKAVLEFDERKVIDTTLGVYERLLNAVPAVGA